MNRESSITRRQFLKGTSVGVTALALGAPYIAPTSAFGAKGRPAPSERIGIGSIGTGVQGRRNMYAFLSLPGAQVIAVCDVDSEHREDAKRRVEKYYAGKSLKGRYGGCTAYNDFEDLLARDDIDAVVISTPNHWHALIAIAAAKAGKDVYCEKPLGLTIAEGRAIVDAMTRYGRVFQVGSQQRSAGNFRFACELVRNGRIGKLQTMEVGLPTGNYAKAGSHPPMPIPKGFDYARWLGPAPWAPYTEGRCHQQFRYIFDYSGGNVTDWGAHHLDIAQWGNGTDGTGPIEVDGRAEYPAEGLYDTAVHYRFASTYANGVRLVCWDYFPRGIRFVGTEGWIFVTRRMIDAHPKSLLTSVIRPDEIHLYRSKHHHQNLLDCMRTRGETVAPVQVAHGSAIVCHLGNIAMRLGRKVRWNPDGERFINDPEADKMLSRVMRSPWRL